LLRGLHLLEDKLVTLFSQFGLPCAVVSPLHPIARGAPLQFPGPLTTQAYRAAPPGFERIVEAKGRPVVAAREHAAGRWGLLGFDVETRNPGASLLLANAARMRAVSPGLRVLSPPSGAVFTAGDTIPVQWASRGGTAGLVRILFNTDGSTVRFPGVV